LGFTKPYKYGLCQKCYAIQTSGYASGEVCWVCNFQKTYV